MLTRTLRSIVVACCVACWASSGFGLGSGPAPRVVVAWPGGPMEVRVAFDRPVDPTVATRAVGRTIEFGEGEKPGVVGRPGGDRGSLRIAAARLVDEGRTLVLVTDPHPREATYRLTLPGVKAAGEPGEGAPVAVSYDLGGVAVEWDRSGDGKVEWSGWWPSPDPSTVREATKGSAGHDRLWSLMSGTGGLTLDTQVKLPEGNATAVLEASSPFEATLGSEMAASMAAGPGSHRATLKAESTGEPVNLSVALNQDAAGPLRVRFGVGSNPLPRPAFVLPWAPPSPPASAAPTAPDWVLTGGDPVKGEAVFRGDQAKCATCHMVRGRGGAIGPDLSNLAGRDRAWVYQNIIEPNASIHPDYLSYTVVMTDGRVAIGIVRAEGADALKVGEIDAKQTIIPRAEVEQLRPSTSSIMPVGLLGAIGEDSTRDLIAYLTTTASKKEN